MVTAYAVSVSRLDLSHFLCLISLNPSPQTSEDSVGAAIKHAALPPGSSRTTRGAAGICILLFCYLNTYTVLRAVPGSHELLVEYVCQVRQRKEETLLPAKIKDTQATQETSTALQSQGPEQEDKMEKDTSRFRTLVRKKQIEKVSSFTAPKKKTLLIPPSEPAVIGEGEDYFLSLFGDSKKPIAYSFNTKKIWKHFSMILEEVGSSSSSAFGDIKIAEVNDLFVKLINSSPNKELEIGNHILQQNMNGKPDSLYHFPPNITIQANSTVTVWTAASDRKHQPPSDFLWKEKDKFTTSPNCTTILCKPNGEAIAWCTPIHWKQAWEKLETDIEFQRSSVVNATPQKHMFHWPKATTTAKEKLNQSDTDISNYQMEVVPVFLKREKEIPPTLFMNRSPWCHSPDNPAHPHCPLIEPHNPSMYESSLNSLPRPQSAMPNPNAALEAQESIKCGEKMCSCVMFSAKKGTGGSSEAPAS
ncbi:lamin tail domain-containing protein 1 [Myotis yumanensis]|uniref:lamin tail domain-containing protein 1 n=1 Tax=Myotis yumanensis TaxID=159337 RepID=UPI0038D1B002